MDVLLAPGVLWLPEQQAVPHAQHWGLRLCFASAWLQ